ncbi:MAG: transporter substrate-binding domain-containing protein [Clostridia bacterium]|nr:transporter substrate-binding domain-containing protein [Clostridia bacterium]
MKKLFAFILSLSMIFALAACGAEPVPAQSTEAPDVQTGTVSSSALEKIKSAGKLVVGTEAQYAPYEFKDLDANFAGCDIFLAEKIAEKLGVELEIVDMAFDGIIPAAQAGQVDLGIAAFTNTPERAEVIDFSDIYEVSLQYLVVAAENVEKYSTKEALSGLKIGSQKGTIQSNLVVSAFPDSELFELEKYPALALEVQNGNIAGLVVDAAVGDSLVANSNGALAVSAYEFTKEEASFGKSVVIQKGNEDLVAVVNEVIAQVLADGSYQKAYDDAVAHAASLGL